MSGSVAENNVLSGCFRREDFDSSLCCIETSNGVAPGRQAVSLYFENFEWRDHNLTPFFGEGVDTSRKLRDGKGSREMLHGL
jgi:hypothetical protein